MSTLAELPAPRVVVSGHTGNGTSTFVADEQASQFHPFGPKGSTFSTFHSRLSVPVSNQYIPPDLSGQIPRNTTNGVVFCTTDIKPGSQTPMHRTLSLDYCAVITGEIVLLLDGGEEKTVRAGEYIVQRGVNHAWANRTQYTCRIMVVMVAAERVRLEDGRELGDEDAVKK